MGMKWRWMAGCALAVWLLGTPGSALQTEEPELMLMPPASRGLLIEQEWEDAEQNVGMVMPKQVLLPKHTDEDVPAPEVESEALCYIQSAPTVLQFLDVEMKAEWQFVGRVEDEWWIDVMDTSEAGCGYKLYVSSGDMISPEGEGKLDGMITFMFDMTLHPLGPEFGRVLIAEKEAGTGGGLNELRWGRIEGPWLYVAADGGMEGAQYSGAFTWTLEMGPG